MPRKELAKERPRKKPNMFAGTPAEKKKTRSEGNMEHHREIKGNAKMGEISRTKESIKAIASEYGVPQKRIRELLDTLKTKPR